MENTKKSISDFSVKPVITEKKHSKALKPIAVIAQAVVLLGTLTSNSCHFIAVGMIFIPEIYYPDHVPDVYTLQINASEFNLDWCEVQNSADWLTNGIFDADDIQLFIGAEYTINAGDVISHSWGISVVPMSKSGTGTDAVYTYTWTNSAITNLSLWGDPDHINGKIFVVRSADAAVYDGTQEFYTIPGGGGNMAVPLSFEYDVSPVPYTTAESHGGGIHFSSDQEIPGFTLTYEEWTN